MALLVFMGCGDGDARHLVPDATVPDATVPDSTVPDATEPEPARWSVVTSGLDEALLSVGGSAADDVWAVGADKGKGPIALHWDGSRWERRATGTRGDLWWVHGFGDGTAVFGGGNATLIRWNGTAFESLNTAGLARQTIFGVWGEPNDLYAVGSAAGRDGFIWHYDGKSWSNLPLPRDVALDEHGEVPGLFKVWGNAQGVYAVGAHGLVLRGDAEHGFETVASGQEAPLYTVFGDDSHVYTVGGDLQGVILELGAEGAPVDRSPEAAPLIQGVCVGKQGEVIGTGAQGQIFERNKSGAFKKVDTGLVFEVQTLHAAWFDPEGNLWAVGGNALSGLDKGAIVHRGVEAEAYTQPPPVDAGVVMAVCPAANIDPAPDKSIARRWDEQILGAIRRDLPRPTVHARNLYHLSAAMWDGYAAYDAQAKGVFVDETGSASDLAAARQETISYAAYGVLKHRYAAAIGGPVSVACFDAFMRKLGYDPSDTGNTGSSARALGNRIAQTIISKHVADGANEAENYKDTTGYVSPNTPLVVESVGTVVKDPAAWQQLNLAMAETQNGIVTTAGVQGYIGAQWNKVTPFAMSRTEPDALFHDPGAAPALGPELRNWAAQVVERTAALDSEDGVMMDLSPGGYGNNALASNAGSGHPLNPITGKPYVAQNVRRGDFGRVLAEFWADGPNSETPPGHWNTLANTVADAPGFARKWRGQGDALDPLSWDVRVYLALNGAEHDAAITCWGIKRKFTSARPITLIRYMAGLGQSSDPKQPAYNPGGLPLRPGVIEVITEESSAAGARHAHLARHVGEIAVRSYRGEPADRVHQIGGVGWIRALEWIPYQRRTFVTPAFPGFTSGHSTFSRAAAEVLSLATGSAYFPGGLGEYVAKANAYLVFERGPTTEIRLQWATYYDAADQAGQSRIYGGIHIEADDFMGRKTGSLVGIDAFAKAETFF
jgi:hypothetical protein